MTKIIYTELTHQYHEINLIENGYETDFENPENNVKIQDDFYCIISDSFSWIESKVSNGAIINGLDYCGVSELDSINIEKFREIILAWYSLYELANDPIELKDHVDYGETDTIRYLKFDKKELLSELRKIISLCDEAIEKHTGIMILGL